ncbi:MAG: hypothetical protein IKW85_02990 [Muribaculaceae bacterium]|nr:hypothetical protein [Muribaculaceae bacterium]
MMDLNSPEFYTIAFVVAMALVALLMGKREKQPPSTYIVQLATTPAEGESDDTLCLAPMEGGRIRLERNGLSHGDEETVNLVITIREDECSIVEKKGVRRRHAEQHPVGGEISLKCLKPGLKYHMRYESQLTSAWATFTFDTTSPQPTQVTLRY